MQEQVTGCVAWSAVNPPTAYQFSLLASAVVGPASSHMPGEADKWEPDKWEPDWCLKQD